jgi:hypothetical protein
MKYGIVQQIKSVQNHDTFTNAVLNDLEFTNFSGVEIPMRASLKRYFLNKSGQAALLCEFDFSVGKIHGDFDAESFCPYIASHSVISDYRFSRGKANVPPLVFARTTTGSPSISEAKLNEGYQMTQMDWEKLRPIPNCK